MPSAITQAGGTSEPSEYAALAMDSHITGLWTQRNPIRDADVAYMVRKYYGGSRFDSLIDGVNREMTARLTSARRPGHSIYARSIPPVFSFYSYKYIQDGAEILRVLADTNDAILDITPDQPATSIFSKDGKGRKARFVGVNTELFWTDGGDSGKWVNGGKAWAPTKTFNVGDLLVDTNGNLQVFEAQALNLIITSIEVRVLVNPDPIFSEAFLIVTFSQDVPILPALQPVTFSGVTTFPGLNGTTLDNENIESGWNLNLATDQLAFRYVGPVYPNAPDTGTAATAAQFDKQGNPLTGTTGASAPVWNPAIEGITQDGPVGAGVTWTNFGTPHFNWTPAAPTITPTLKPGPAMRYWYPNLDLTGVALGSYSILDSLGSVQVNLSAPGPGFMTGNVPPTWNTSLGGQTKDGGIGWLNVGDPGGSWVAQVKFPIYSSIIDPNGFLQYVVTSIAPGESGTGMPSFLTTPGAATTDNNLTWINGGAASQLVTGGYTYGYAYHAVDGSVSTMSDTVKEIYGALGVNGKFMNLFTVYGSGDPQVDQIWLFRTAMGQSTLVFLDAIANPGLDIPALYYDTIADTSTTGNQALIPQIPAPIAHQNDPPPPGFTAPVYHLGRIWYIVDNKVGFSGGPDTITGNGNTAFPRLNNFAFPEQPIKIRPVTVQGGGTLVYTTSHTYIIPGAGSGDSPFQQPQVYMGNVGLMNYDAEEFVGSTAYLFTTKRKLVSFDPSAGYVEWGFPIGDQFKKVTTGGFNAALFDPRSTYVTWHEADSGDTGLYVADGAVGWFRFSPVASPETGFIWSPFAAIAVGTTAVQSIETSPGNNSLLVGPVGPIEPGHVLMRDPSVSTDNGVAFPSWETIGSISLCDTGEIVEVAHIALKSIKVGAPPSVAVLFGEIAATQEVPFDEIEITENDPPNLPESQTMFSHRYSLLQNGQCPLCDTMQLRIDYGMQDAPDELIKHAIYGAHHEERKQQ